MLSKPLERYVLSHLPIVMDEYMIHHLQSGLVSKYSCHTALSVVTAVDRSDSRCCVFIFAKKPLVWRLVISV